MSTFNTFGSFHSVRATHAPKLGMIRVASNNADLVFFLDGTQAVKLRDDLSRAITEAAQASAKTKAVEAEGTPA